MGIGQPTRRAELVPRWCAHECKHQSGDQDCYVRFAPEADILTSAGYGRAITQTDRSVASERQLGIAGAIGRTRAGRPVRGDATCANGQIDIAGSRKHLGDVIGQDGFCRVTPKLFCDLPRFADSVLSLGVGFRRFMRSSARGRKPDIDE